MTETTETPVDVPNEHQPMTLGSGMDSYGGTCPGIGGPGIVPGHSGFTPGRIEDDIASPGLHAYSMGVSLGLELGIRFALDAIYDPDEVSASDSIRYGPVVEILDGLLKSVGSAPSAPPHTRHTVVSPTWPGDCLEGDCDHRDEDGQPEGLEVCPSSSLDVCIDCMVEAGYSDDPETWGDAPLTSVAACKQRAQEPAPSASWHFGRSFQGTKLEDTCPCEKAPCGLVTLAAASAVNCTEHAVGAGKTIRQSHPADRCPVVVASAEEATALAKELRDRMRNQEWLPADLAIRAADIIDSLVERNARP